MFNKAKAFAFIEELNCSCEFFCLHLE
jgi:hypothetical protein